MATRYQKNKCTHILFDMNCIFINMTQYSQIRVLHENFHIQIVWRNYVNQWFTFPHGNISLKERRISTF